jgi:hypothetical protein
MTVGFNLDVLQNILTNFLLECGFFLGLMITSSTFRAPSNKLSLSLYIDDFSFAFAPCVFRRT